MIDRIYTLRTDQDRLFAIGLINANWEALSATSEPLSVHITQKPETRRNRQNRYYWGGVLRQIAEQAFINGRQYEPEIWHRHFAKQFNMLEEKTGTDGVIFYQPRSTTKMSVKEFAEFTEQVTAAGAELGVKFYMLEQF